MKDHLHTVLELSALTILLYTKFVCK